MSRWMRFVRLSSLPKNLLTRLRPNRALLGKAIVVAGMMLIGGVAFLLGRSMGIGTTAAQSPPVKFGSPAPSNPAVGGLYTDDYLGRVVAYIHGNVPITRAELAEHLIARFGAERLDYLVNRKIVERACQAQGISVTDFEVEDQFAKDLRSFGQNVTPKIFQDQILKKYNKTLYEWKEDVIRPKIAMAKLVTPMVTVTQEDLTKGFEGRYGPKVQCRMIVFQNKNLAMRAHEKISRSANVENEFLAEAKQQFIPSMAATAGAIPPIHMHFGDPRIEKEAFRMNPKDISQVIEMPDNTAILMMCEDKVPADREKRFETERLALRQEIFELKLAQRIQEHVVQLRKDAAPRLMLARQPGINQIVGETETELNLRGVEPRP